MFISTGVSWGQSPTKPAPAAKKDEAAKAPKKVDPAPGKPVADADKGKGAPAVTPKTAAPPASSPAVTVGTEKKREGTPTAGNTREPDVASNELKLRQL
ncbi:hypothetical protein KKF84_12230, partial [Myxococcota bacterium]|nr:hypothetical protein [Myxococcota bacterium]